MFMLSFVNGVREAQGAPPVSRLALIPGGEGRTALERAMGCRIGTTSIRFTSPDAARAAAVLSGSDVLEDGCSIPTPAPISRYGRWIEASQRGLAV